MHFSDAEQSQPRHTWGVFGLGRSFEPQFNRTLHGRVGASGPMMVGGHGTRMRDLLGIALTSLATTHRKRLRFTCTVNRSRQTIERTAGVLEPRRLVPTYALCRKPDSAAAGWKKSGRTRRIDVIYAELPVRTTREVNRTSDDSVGTQAKRGGTDKHTVNEQGWG